MHHQFVVLLELLTTATLVALFARRLRVPYVTALVVTGLGLSYFKLVPNVAINSEIILNLFLPVLLFEAAINTDATHLRENVRPVFLLSTAGMLVMTGVTGALVHWLLGYDWPTALLLGSMLSITDTVAVLAIFKDLKVPTRLATIVEGESLFNDGTALVLFRAILAVAMTGHFNFAGSLIDLAAATAGGLLVGAVAGLVASYVLRATRDHLTEIMLSTLVALSSYFIAEQLHVSGVIAVVASGLVIGNYGWRRALAPSSQIAMGSFWEYAGFGVNSVVFLLVGLNINFVNWHAYIPTILVAFVAIFIGRAIAIVGGFVALRPGETDPVPLPWQIVMVWGNLKGSLTMALAISLPVSLGARTDLITIVFGVVLLSLALQGMTLGPLIRALGLSGGSSLRQLFEREQLKVIAARAAQAELKTLHEAGILSKSNYERLRARYQVSLAQSERELRRLGTEFQEHWDVVLEEIRHRLLLVEKGAAINALREKLISESVAREFLEDLDQRLVQRIDVVPGGRPAGLPVLDLEERLPGVSSPLAPPAPPASPEPGASPPRAVPPPGGTGRQAEGGE
jgi:CPA1 family monovalent cation:H+ antiporter